ncbi:MAG TPA: UDP-N-acetylmuramate dehydrogenase [Actinomycetota bacterium]
MDEAALVVREQLAGTLGGRLRALEPLARHTSYRIGGPADLLALPDTAAELAIVVRTCREAGVPLTLLGAGSNLLVGDGGMPGVVVKLGPGFRRVTWRADGVVAGAGALLGKLARAAAARGLAGLEAAEGIPGTVGGAVVMNAGAYGWETGDVLAEVEGVDERGRLRTLARSDFVFHYRRTELPPGLVVTSATFALGPDDPAAIAARLGAVRDRRVASQPHGASNAGSIFKNPGDDHAGRLIEAVGLKGRRIGRARVSERHANFIVNDGGATAADVQALMSEAQRTVWERSGVWLEPEIRLVGRW